MRYFFDVDDGERRTVDRDGHELASRAAVRREAVAVLPAVAADVVPSDDRRTFQVMVRDGDGRSVFHASLTIVAGWLI